MGRGQNGRRQMQEWRQWEKMVMADGGGSDGTEGGGGDRDGGRGGGWRWRTAAASAMGGKLAADGDDMGDNGWRTVAEDGDCVTGSGG